MKDDESVCKTFEEILLFLPWTTCVIHARSQKGLAEADQCCQETLYLCDFSGDGVRIPCLASGFAHVDSLVEGNSCMSLYPQQSIAKQNTPITAKK